MPQEKPGAPEAGDFAAYATAAWPRLVRTAHMLTGDFHEAEDLVQTTLAKVYARWRRIPRDDVDFYVRRSLVNNNISRVRKRRVAHLLTPFLPERVHERQAGHADSIAQRAAVTQALAALSARLFGSDEARAAFQQGFEKIAADSAGSKIIGSAPVTIEPYEVVAVVRGPAGFRSSSSFEHDKRDDD